MGLGHGHPDVVRAIVEQAQRLQHVCIHVASYEPYIALCERLVKLLPHGPAGTKAMLLNSGAEAVENAIKIARQATGRSAVLCYTEGFHGRTMLAMTLTSKVGTKRGAGPYAPEIYRLPFPNAFRRGDGLAEGAFIARELQRLRDSFDNTIAAEQIAAVIIEPVQGEGGMVPCPPSYLRGLREICDDKGIMLICDEVQCGLGRTGRWACFEHAGITPDLSTWAKALGGGMPVAAVVGKAAVMDAGARRRLRRCDPGRPHHARAADRARAEVPHRRRRAWGRRDDGHRAVLRSRSAQASRRSRQGDPRALLARRRAVHLGGARRERNPAATPPEHERY
jgi:4-aminobutyrate aminotransferase/(S)-3-amino-2-methylpropionate transaminase